MNSKIFITSLLALSACSFLSAQITVDFTSGEGYADGALDNNANWTADAGFTVDATAGTLTMPNVESQKAAYGEVLTGNNYSASIVFTLDFAGQVVQPTSNVQMGLIEFSGGGLPFASLRHMAVSPGTFDLYFFTNSAAIGSAGNFTENGDNFAASLIGLDHDGSVWTDAVSDKLEFTYSLSLNGDEWTSTTSLANLTRPQVDLSAFTATGTITGGGPGSDPFRDAANTFVITNRSLDAYTSSVMTVDSVTIVPEPGTYALMLGMVAFGAILYRRRRR